ncbi:mitochondrial import receptor subunit TOM9-2-like [Amaranthus tricolor]|uniref:mitochondrial import receptor subunit TOM9-2-like n=1 Tax=Amaranthus tricolor TaxID=29722 RepID=UPI0025842A06|nr:mitochondrial import receptor subunit TOM9-2-like [Amaranthus tricolor]
MASNSGRKRIGSSSNNGRGGVLGRVSSTVSESAIFQYSKQTAADAACVTKKLLKSTGKAAWILGTSFLVIALPLIIELERDGQLEAMELQQASLLGTPPSSGKNY